ncbi:MAG: hypothetical protein ACXAD7_20580 [Candidatus Kariarchaeaceae archaeon]|jgi:hypothetical protein
MSDVNPSAGECIWKPSIKKKSENKVEFKKFPCRYPDKTKTDEVCNPCLLGDLFVMNFTQMQWFRQQQGMNEEIMTYLRNLTSDDDLNNFK